MGRKSSVKMSSFGLTPDAARRVMREELRAERSKRKPEPHDENVPEHPFPLLPITSATTIERCAQGAQPMSAADSPTVLICSYPKSGTTWLQNIVATLVSRGAELDHISDYTPFYEADSTWEKLDSGDHPICINQASLGRRMFNTHLLPHMLPQTNRKVIYVVRDGQDVVNSFYQHLSNQIVGDSVSFSGSFEQFFVEWLSGEMPFGRWTDHLKAWRGVPVPGVLYLSYEQMKTDLSGAVHAVADFLELELSPAEVEALVPRFTIEAMKANRKQFEPVSVQWKPGFNFVRKGVVGDSRNVFTPELQAKYSQMLEEAWPEGIPERVPRSC